MPNTEDVPRTDRKRIIIAGSRSITEFYKVQSALSQLTAGGPTRGRYEIVSGGADGVDTLGEQWAEDNDCPVTTFEPDWEDHGKAAGPIRNAEMAEYGDMLVAIWDGESRGTKDMIDKALDGGLEVHVYNEQ